MRHAWAERMRAALSALTPLSALAMVSIAIPAAAPAQQDDLPESAYKAEAIPAGLAEGAFAVLRHEETTFRVESVSKAELKVRRIVTILNDEGKEFGALSVWYDRFHEVTEFEGALYDAAGEEIGELEGDDILDYPATSGYSLYDDNRVKAGALYHGRVPYTVEFRYTVKYDGNLGWPSWSPEEEHLAVERAVFNVRVPAQVTLRSWTRGSIAPKVSTVGAGTYYSWEALSLKPFEPEPFSAPEVDRDVLVVIAPEKFEIDGYEGDMSTWESFGRWIGMLASGRQELPEGAAAEAAKAVAGAATFADSVSTLYRLLQDNTRYVSVQLGIGGWQPFDAQYVYDRKYGDCKALTNYMHSLLKSVGIVSHYALITNSARAVTELSDFPSQQFNHVILCVPSAKDTIWLECTSQESPFNTLGSSNENRHALLVTPDGGRLVRTPASAPEANAQIRRIAANLDSRGNVVMDVRVDLTGNQQEDVRGSLVGASPTDRDEWLRGYVEIPSFTVRSADYSAVAPRTSRGNLRFGLEVPKYATKTANRLVLNPNVMAKRRYVPKALTNRKFPVRFTYRYLDSDTVLFKIPAGFRVEALPKPVTLEADFGSFASWATALSDSVIMYTRTVRLNATELPAARYQEYRDYAGKIAVADKAVVSLVRKP